MTETNHDRLSRLHGELAHLYRSGVSNDDARVQHHWARIDRLEDVVIREALLEDIASRERA